MSDVKKTNEIGKGKPGPGRPKGVVNKVTADVKAMILEALDGAGGAAYLQSQARENPAAFMTLVGKVLPLTVTGDKDAPLTLTITRRIIGPDGP